MEKKKRKKKGVKKSNVDEFIVHGHFRSKIMHNFSLQFSLYFGKKTFLWARGENTWVPSFIFFPPHPTKHTQKNFPSHFLYEVFHPPYFTSKQTQESKVRTYLKGKKKSHVTLAYFVWLQCLFYKVMNVFCIVRSISFITNFLIVLCIVYIVGYIHVKKC